MTISFPRRRILPAVTALSLLSLTIYLFSSSSSSSSASPRFSFSNLLQFSTSNPKTPEIYGVLDFVVNKPALSFTSDNIMDDVDPTKDIDLKIYEKGDQSIGRLSGGEREWKGRRRALDGEVPVVVFSKTYCPYSKGAKTLLAKYDLSPAPHIVELDLRDDNNLLKTLLTRLTGRGTVPNVILKGRSIGGFDSLNELHRDGKLKALFEKAGVVVRGDVEGQ